MLFESIGQGWLFLLLLDIGLCAGLVDEIFRLVPFCCKRLKNHKKYAKSVKNDKKTAKNTQKIEFSQQIKPKTPTPHKKRKVTLSKIFIPIWDFCRTLITGAIFFISVLIFNFGEVRLYLIAAFAVGFCLERTILVRLVQKRFASCYTPST